jgi:subtilase family serine protease
VYLTSVGGTDLETNSAGGAWSSETAWADSGGGISPDKYAIPSWQTATAAGCSSCSKTYRNGPDVSANANFTFYVCADQTTCTANEYGGTSFATPMWAGYLALANQQQAANGGKPLGFINPTLYTIGLGSSYHTDFHDITGGSNGYPATVGYDLATGLGSPNGSGLINSLTGGGPPAGFTISASPTSITVAPGSSGSYKITTTISGNFDAAITLTAAGEGASESATFSPNPIAAPGAGTSTLTVKVGKNAAVGTHTITITATGGGVTETTKVTLIVAK